MSKITRTEKFPVSVDKFYKVITDYESYPEFVAGVKKVSILEKKKGTLLVSFSVEMIKSITYTLRISEVKGESISWEFEEGDLFKKNSGGWILKKLGAKECEVTYHIDAEFKGLVPKMVINKLVESTLPEMMKSYATRAGAV